MCNCTMNRVPLITGQKGAGVCPCGCHPLLLATNASYDDGRFILKELSKYPVAMIMDKWDNKCGELQRGCCSRVEVIQIIQWAVW